MIARTKDGIRMAIDIIVIFPAIFVLALFILDSSFRSSITIPCLWAIFFLLLGILINKWLKPKPITEQIARLQEEELHLLDKINAHNKIIDSMEKMAGDHANSQQNDINAQLMRIQEKERRIELLQRKRSKLEMIKV